MEEIGFQAPENPDKTWEKQINGRVYTFTKTREKEGVFIYGCELRGKDGGSRTGFYSPRDLTPEEIEQAPQFDHFVGRGPAVRTATGGKAE